MITPTPILGEGDWQEAGTRLAGLLKTMGQEWSTVQEIADLLEVTTSRVHNRIDKNHFPSARLATPEETAALLFLRRISIVTHKGVMIIRKCDTASGL